MSPVHFEDRNPPDPGDCFNHFQLGTSYQEVGLVDDAIAEFEAAAESPELVAQCLVHLAACFREKGDRAAAIRSYRKALELSADDPTTYGDILFELGELVHEVQG
jgi:tetratricopeptide (TPR) repeat protein